ncbi:MAG: bifunctional hydroxymethylpyrimidine kinase/phosphomethylpyrimidine kinase [Thermodesulfobacteriota bacterium]
MRSDLSQTALVIAGSDPSGGAGIQADIKTFTTLGVYCGAVITAVTCQNTRGVSYFFPLSPTLVKDQVNNVLTDLNISHIKIGMLGSPAIAQGLKEILADYKGEIIFDPVTVAGSGDSLYDNQEQGGTIEDIREVIKLATVITPNLDELAAISGMDCSESKKACQASAGILAAFSRLRAVCLTGGHTEKSPELVTDFLIKRPLPPRGAGSSGKEPEVFSLSHSHIKSPNLHGTGCIFSSAFTAYHLLSGEDRKAFTGASEFTTRLIEKSASYHIGEGNGPLLHFLN